MTTKKLAKKKYTKYHNDGSPWGTGWLVGGKMEGSWAWFRKDGSKMRSGHFKAGKQTGTWVTYDKKGTIVKVTEMK